MQLELDARQQAALEAALESYLSDMSVEIADTDRKAFRDGLKEQRDILAGLLESMRVTAGT